jgi:hypothetical protein
MVEELSSSPTSRDSTLDHLDTAQLYIERQRLFSSLNTTGKDKVTHTIE